MSDILAEQLKKALWNEVQDALVNAGEQLKKALWNEQDKEFLAQRAQDLVGLYLKAGKSTDPKKQEQYRLAAKMVVQHVTMLALTRMCVVEKHIFDVISKFFMTVLVPELKHLLPSLFGV